MIILPRYGRYGASSRYRHYMFAEFLSGAGEECKIFPFFIFRRFKLLLYPLYVIIRIYVIVRYREHRKYVEGDFFPYLGIRLVPVSNYVIDFDDPVWEWDRILRSFSENKWTRLVSGSDMVVSGSSFTIDYWTQRMRGELTTAFVPTSFSCDLYRQKIRLPTGEKPHVLWIGSPSTSKHVDWLFEVDVSLIYAFNWHLIGYSGKIVEGDTVCIHPWSREAEERYGNLCSVAISPLMDTDESTRFKCGFKIVQYLALGLPVVANPFGANLIWKDAIGVQMCQPQEFKYFLKNSLTKLTPSEEIIRYFRSNISHEVVLPELRKKLENVWN